ncbi:hypothetical protein EVAR_11916_1 [Eumeta japonica]|uniref:Uncharacterized protein n=1 Tax=Eumeta variegata TaxID=151549 RepID=A0A4C1U8G6_EUMVA|nr:hypothetical protein EVAR_11916_1 [Eumeta japonica]
MDDLRQERANKVKSNMVKRQARPIENSADISELDHAPILAFPLSNDWERTIYCLGYFSVTQNFKNDQLHRVRPDGTCECRRRVTCAMDDAWWKSSRHRMSQETVTGRFPSLPGRRRLAAAGWSKGA